MVVGMKNWKEMEPELRRDWETRFGYIGLDWQEIGDAYRFGWEAAQRPEFQGCSWEQVQTDLSWHWYRPLSAEERWAWDYVKEAVEEGWRQGREMLRRTAR